MKFEFKINRKHSHYKLCSYRKYGCPAANATGSNAACTYPNRSTFTVSRNHRVISILRLSPLRSIFRALLNGTNANATAGWSSYFCMPEILTLFVKILTNIGITSGTGESSGTQTTFSIK